MKVELDALSVPTRGVLEKEELVRRLYESRIVARRRQTSAAAAADDDYDDYDDDDDDDDDAANGGKKETRKKKKKRSRRDDDDDENVDDDDDVDGAVTPGGRHAEGARTGAGGGADVGKRRTIVTTPFTYFELGPSGPVVASACGRDGAADDGGGAVYIRPSRARYAAIKVRLKNEETSPPPPTTTTTTTMR